MTSKPIALLMTVCSTGHSYVTRFYGENAEDHALAFFERKGMTHAIDEVEGEFIDQGYKRIIEKLYPTCEHGLSAHLCEGPQHYPYDDEERAHYGY
jgi:hypothetical protein